MSSHRRVRFSVVDIATIVVLLLAVLLVSLPGGALYNPVHQWLVRRRTAAAVRKAWPILVKTALPLYPGSGLPDLIEFTDYQCPFCRAAQPVVDSAIQEGVRIAIIQLPLSMHPRAHTAALTALCGAAAGQFPEVHEYLMHHDEWLARSDSVIVPLTTDPVENTMYTTCESGSEVQAILDTQMAIARNLQIAATPTFVSAQEILDEAPTTTNLRKLVGQR